MIFTATVKVKPYVITEPVEDFFERADATFEKVVLVYAERESEATEILDAHFKSTYGEKTETTILNIEESKGDAPPGGASVWSSNESGDVYITGKNVGIGIDEPKELLHVQGNLLVQTIMADQAMFANLPTSPDGLEAGYLWKDEITGVLMVAQEPRER